MTKTMKTTTVMTILTKSGHVGFELKEHNANGRKSYSWTGKWGAGSGETLETYLVMAYDYLTSKRGSSLG